MNARIEGLVKSGRLERAEAPDSEIAGLWSNALRIFSSAMHHGIDPGTRVTLAYDSGRVAATAIVRANALRVRATNHHEMTISAARELVEGDLAGALVELDRLRPLRIELEYGWQRQGTATEAEHALQVTRTILQLGAAYLHERLPGLRDLIALPDG